MQFIAKCGIEYGLQFVTQFFLNPLDCLYTKKSKKSFQSYNKKLKLPRKKSKISVVVYKNGAHSSDGTIPWKEFKYVLNSDNAKDIVKSIVDGLASLLDGNGYIDELGIAEATEFNYFKG